MNNINRLNIRVYGLLVNEHREVLLSKEKIGDIHFTKFPGGGLELGEGIKDCLIREFEEEVSISVDIESHYYTTDFFLQSAFRETDQLVSIYYKVTTAHPLESIRLDEFDIENDGRIEQQQFVWIPLAQLDESMVTFPIDKVVVRMLRKENG
ncbi:MAG: NUDIX hydrolase [Bacteroidota bacterium]